MPPNTVKVARTSGYGNPHNIGWCSTCGAEHTRNEAIAKFRAEVDDACSRALIRDALRGKNLACFCPLDEPCHADVLLEIANG